MSHNGEICLRPFFGYSILNFKEWKKKRKALVKNLGPYLIEFSETEIKQMFSVLQSELSELCIETETPERVLLGLLEISVLTFFRQSFQQIKELYPLISIHVKSKSRDVCKAAVSCIRYAVEDSMDAITLLRRQLDLVNECLTPQNANQYLFNGLTILRMVGRFIPSEIFVFTLNHMSEICKAIYSDDLGLSKSAIKVIQIHLLNSPPSVQMNLIQSLFIDCTNVLHETNVQSYSGAIRVCQILYGISPSIFTEKIIADFFTIFLKIASTQNASLICHIYDFVIRLSQRHPQLFEPKANEYLLILISHLIKGTDLQKLLSTLIDLIQCYVYNNHRNVQIQSVIDLLSLLVSKQQYTEFEDKIFDVLLTVLTFYPSVIPPNSLFLKCEPSKKYLKALHMRPSIIKEIRSYLLEYFGKGIPTRSDKNSQLISVLMVQILQTSLFDTLSPLYEMLLPFIRSPYEEVRLRMIKTLTVFKNVEANRIILKLAVIDESKRVRLRALKYVDPSLLVNHPQSLTQLLVDPSFKVRRKAIPLIALASQLSVMITPIIVVFFNDFLSSYVANSTPSKSAKACSLLPVIAAHFQQGYEPFMTMITWICVKFLYGNEEIKPVTSSTVIDGFLQQDILLCPHRDMIANSFSIEISDTEINKSRIYKCENQKWIEKRNSCLFMALGNISFSLMPYLQQLLPIYIKTFNGKHSDIVYSSAIESLIQIVISSECKVNFLNAFPELLPSITRLLVNRSISQDVAILLMKLIGTLGASTIASQDVEKEKTGDDICTFNSSYFTSFVMKLLIRIMKIEATPSIFKAITTIVVHDTKNSVQYLRPILQTFIQAIGHENDKITLWNQLEIILYYSEIYVCPYIDDLLVIILPNMSFIYGIRISVCLAYNLKAHFQSAMKKLYPLALHFLDTKSNEAFKLYLKLITLGIIFQHQSIELFINKVEQLEISDMNELKLKCLMKSFSILLQNASIALYSSRIDRIASLTNQSFPEIYQLLYNLFIFGYKPINLLRKLDNIPEIEKVQDAVDKGILSLEKLPFIQPKKIGFSTRIFFTYQNTTVAFKKKIKNIFRDPKRPLIYNNSRAWLEDICTNVVENSPYISIRSCIQVISQSQQFRDELFPVAFLSCWKSATENEKQLFSEIIKSILLVEKADRKLNMLIDLLDSAGCPFQIEDKIIAQACNSTAKALYYYQRQLMNAPDDIEIIRKLLDLNSRMGRIDSAKGILSSISNILEKSEMARWRENLGEWEKALDLYKSSSTLQNPVDLSNCYAHLQLWDEIRNMSTEFEKMDEKDKIKCAIYFAWAYYHSKDLNAVSYYMKYFPAESNLNIIQFSTVFFIASNHYDAARAYIEDGFRVLTQNLGVFSGSDIQEASRKMLSAQHFIELTEALEMKEEGDIKASSIWQNRLKTFSQESTSWMKLIEIRSLVISPSEHTDSFLKMLSVLRKERKWKLIDAYCDRFFSKSNSTPVLLARLKIMWERGKKREALSLLTSINKIFKHDEKYLIQEFNNLNLETQKQLFEFLGIKNFDRMTTDQKNRIISKIKIDHSINARLLRIQGIWQYRLYTAKTSSISSLNDICQVLQESMKIKSDDYRTWSTWAYASSRSLPHFSDRRSELSLNAIKGFLKATQLQPSKSLHFLCQMFSIFFRYGDEVKLPDSIKKEIIDLPPIIVQQIVPQIVVHISHQDPNISQVVIDIINQFGSQHFQAVVYPLNLLSKVGTSNQIEVAKNILDLLGSQHPKTYSDAQLFIDGMLRSALSWSEIWITILNTASKAQQMNDIDSVISLIQKGFTMIENPQCEVDRAFLMQFGSSLQKSKYKFERYKEEYQKHQGKEISYIIHREMWDPLKLLYAEMEDKVKKIDKIQLTKISYKLASTRNFSLSIPGTYHVNNTSPQLDYIDPILTVLSSQQRPRAAYMNDINGQKYKFLLKGNEDLRLDQRIMQFFNLVNLFLKNNRNTQKFGVSILDYAIIPIDPHAGLIAWVTGADTIQQLVHDYRNHIGMKENLELEMIGEYTGPFFNSLSALQRYEVYEIVKAKTKANELREMFWLRSPDPVSWLERNRIFTISTALMSMAGYTIGLGDRHPSNIMVQRHTGRCLHIDFGDSFEVAMKRQSFAERVPFRLTRMIVNALDSSNYNGLFRKCCEDVLWILRENKSAIIAQMEVFIHEPIFYGKEIRHDGEAQKGIIERIAAKLAGNDPVPYSEPNKIYDVSQQLDTLIKTASDPYNYMRHYVGWCPFW